jgi:hypothetical protein
MVINYPKVFYTGRIRDESDKDYAARLCFARRLARPRKRFAEWVWRRKREAITVQDEAEREQFFQIVKRDLPLPR